MTKYRDAEILKLIVGLLGKLKSNVGYPPYNYSIFLDLDPDTALCELAPRLRRLRYIKTVAQKGYSYYFLTDYEYMIFLIEEALAECLNVYLNMKLDGAPIPPLYDDRDIYAAEKVFSPLAMGKMVPFRKWLKTCQEKKNSKTRTAKL